MVVSILKMKSINLKKFLHNSKNHNYFFLILEDILKKSVYMLENQVVNIQKQVFIVDKKIISLEVLNLLIINYMKNQKNWNLDMINMEIVQVIMEIIVLKK